MDSELQVQIITLEPEETEYVREGDDSQQVVIPANETEAEFTIGLVDDELTQPEGKFTVEIQAGTNYRLAEPFSVSLFIADNDQDPAEPAPDATGDELPLVSLFNTGEDSIEEGESIELAVVVSEPWSEDRAIEVNVFEWGDGSDFIAGENEVLVATIPADEISGVLSVATVDDETAEQGADVGFEIAENEEYQTDLTSGASVFISDNDTSSVPTVETTEPVVEDRIPDISVAVGDYIQIEEGGIVEIALSATELPVSDLQIGMVVQEVDGADFLVEADRGDATVAFPAGESEVIRTITTIDDEDTEGDGFILIQLQPGEGYGLGAQSSVEVEVWDDESTPVVVTQQTPTAARSIFFSQSYESFDPNVSIAADTHVTEGQPVRLAVQSGAPGGVNVNLQIRTRGDYFTGREFPSFVRIPYNDATRNRIVQYVDIPTVDDNVIEWSGRLIATILPGTGYRVTRGASEVTVIIENNDIPQPDPEISIAAVADKVTEGEPAQFRISSSTGATRTVNFELRTRGDFFTGQDLPGSVEISAGTAAIVEVPTVDDNRIEWSGRVFVTLRPGDGYSIAAGMADTVAVVVENNDTATTLPAVAIEAVSESVGEGSPARFRISSAEPLNQIVDLEFRTRGDYFTGAALPTSVNMAGGTEAFVDIPTVSNDTFGWSGRVFGKIKIGDGYSIANPAYNQHQSEEARVVIENNDPRVADDGGLPTVWFEAVNETVTEGEPAVFRVRFSQDVPSDTPLNVEVAFTHTGDLLSEDPADAIRWVQTAGRGMAFRIFTDDDDLVEADGMLTVTGVPGSGYQLSEGIGQSATITIEDNDVAAPGPVPTVSVEYVTEQILEGTSARFRIVGSEPSDRTVRFSVDTKGEFFTGEEFPIRADFAGQDSVIVEIPTVNDGVNEVDGRVFLEIEPGNGYEINQEQRRSMIYMLNDDFPRMVLGSNVVDGRWSGPNLEFHVETGILPIKDTWVTIGITAARDEGVANDDAKNFGGDVLIKAGESRSSSFELDPVNLPDLGTIQSLTASIEGSVYYYSDSTPIVVAFKGPSAAPLPDAETAPVAGTGSSLPEVSIERFSEFVTEGDDAILGLISTHPAPQNLEINVLIDQGTSNFVTGETVIQVPIPEGEMNADVVVSTEDDEIAEGDGGIEVSVLEGAGYVVGLKPLEFVRVLDNDSDTASRAEPENVTGPEISILPLDSSESFWEGGDIQFAIASTSGQYEPLTIQLLVRDAENSEGDYIDEGDIIEVVLPAYWTEIVWTLITVDDGVEEADGDIEVRVLPGDGYHVERDTIASVRVADNDGPDAPASSRPTSVTVPTLQLWADGEVTEGEVADFRITADRATEERYAIQVHLDAGSPYFAGGETELLVWMPAGQTTVTFGLQTLDDEIYLLFGHIGAFIETNDNYNVDPNLQAAFMKVVDNESPEISVSSVNGASRVGDRLEFTIAAANPVPVDTEVEVSVRFEGEEAMESTETVTIREFESQTSLFVETENTGVVDLNRVVVQATPSEEYDLANTDPAAVALVDGDTPLISIENVSDRVVLEGETITLVVAGVEPVETDLTVNVTIADRQGGFYSGETSLEVELSAAQKSHLLTLQLDDNDTDEPYLGEIIASVAAGEGYLPARGIKGRAIMLVRDNDDAYISMTANTNRVIEGETVEFTVSAEVFNDSEYTVFVEVLGFGDFFATQPGVQEVIVSSTRVGTIEYATVDDDVAERDGVIAARIIPNESYELAEGQREDIPVFVVDNDGGRVVSIIPANEEIVEGDAVEFEVATTVPFDESTQLNVAIEIQEMEVTDHPGTVAVTLAPGETSKRFTVAIGEISSIGRFGLILARLQEGDNYRVTLPFDVGETTVRSLLDLELSGELPAVVQADPASGESEPATEAAAAVTATDPVAVVVKPVVHLELLSPRTTEEGTDVQILAVADNPTEEALAVRMEVSNSGADDNFIEDGTVVEVLIPAGENTAVGEFAIPDDEVAESAGSITVELLESEDYERGEEVLHIIAVTDNDGDATATTGTGETTVAAIVPSLTLQASELGPLYEGTATEYLVLSSVPVTEGLEFYVRVSEVGESDFLEGEGYEITGILAATSSVGYVEVGTVDDDVVEEGGRIMVEIVPGEAYELGLTHSAEMEIWDNDSVAPAELSIVSLPLVKAGDLAEFRIVADRAPADDILVNVDVAGEGLLWSDLSLNIPLISGEQETRVFVPTGDEEVGSREVSVTAALQEGEGYVVNSSQSTAVLLLRDRIDPTYLTVEPVRDTVDEGELAVFRVDSSRAQSVPLNFWVDMRLERPGLPRIEEVRQLPMPAGELSRTVEIPTSGSQAFSGTGTASVNLLRGEGYELGDAVRGEVAVNSNRIPLVAMDAPDFFVEEGGAIRVEIQVDPAPESRLEVNLTVEQDGDFVGEVVEFADRGVGRTSVPLNANDKFFIMNIPTVDDDATELDGQVRIRMLPGEGYRLSPDTSSVDEVEIRDNDAPRISMVRAADGPDGNVPTITEGEGYLFELRTSSSTTENLRINLELNQNGGDFVAAGAQTVQLIPAGLESVSFFVQTSDDEIDEADGRLTVSILPGENYNLVEVIEETWTEINVLDNDEAREISIAAISETVEEGEFAVFEISATDLVYREISFATVSTSGEFIGLNPPVSVFMDNDDYVAFQIPTDDDEIDEFDGEISVSLVDTGGYLISQEGQVASVNVTDNDASPVIGFATTDFETVIEGNSIEFELVASRGTYRSVNVRVEEGIAGILNNGEEILEVEFGGAESVVVEIGTAIEGLSDSNGLVIVTILPGDGYEIEDPLNANIFFDIENNTVTPEILVAVEDGLITEGETARFTLSTSISTTREVGIAVSVEGDVVRQVNFPDTVVVDGERGMVLEITTDDDIYDEADGFIILQVLEGEGYLLAEGSTAPARVKVADNDQPILSMRSSVPYIEDGEVIEFYAEALTPVTSDFEVKLAIIDGGDNERRTHYRTVQFQTGETVSSSTVYYAPQQNLYDFNRRIVAELQEGEDYINLDEQYSTTVYVVGQSLPVISVEAINGTVNEGATAQFKIKTLFSSSKELPVKVSVYDNGSGYLLSTVSNTVNIPAEDGEVVFDVVTVDDLIDRTDGTLVAMILEDSGYNLTANSSERTASIVVVDNDVPVITIAGGGVVPELQETGEPSVASFTISANMQRIEKDLEIRYRVSQSGGSVIDPELTTEEVRTVTLPTGGLKTTAELEFDILDDNVSERDGIITVTLLPEADESGTDYTLVEEPFSTVTVVDNDPLTLSITGGDDVIESAEQSVNAVFTISGDRERLEPVTVNYTVESDGDYLALAFSGTVELPAGLPTETVDLQIAIDNDNVDEDDGSVTVTLGAAPEDGIQYTANPASASVGVMDDDVPQIWVRTRDAEVTEEQGAEVAFNIGSSIERAAGRDLTINYEIEYVGTTRGDYFATSIIGRESIILPAGSADVSVPVIFAVENDEVDEHDSEVRLKLLKVDTNDRPYELSDEDSATVDVLDDDVPVVSISAGGDVTEGATSSVNAIFTISANMARQGRDLEIGYSRDTGTGNFLTSTTNGIVFLPSGGEDITVNVELVIVDDEIDENDGMVTVTLIADNRRNPAYTIDENDADGDGENHTASVGVIDDDVPEITVVKVADVTEGPSVNAEFVISSDIERENRELTIGYTVTADGNFLNSSDIKTDTLVLPAGASTVKYTHPIAIVDDSEAEADGSVTFTVNDDTNTVATYTTDSSDTITIEDDDTPVISITEVAASVAESSSAQVMFTVSADKGRRTGYDLNVGYTVVDSTDFLASSDEGDGVVVLPGGSVSTTATITLDVVDNAWDEVDGTISVSLRDGTGYIKHTDADENTASVTVTDNDTPVISIENSDTAHTEGDTITFSVVSDIERKRDLTIKYSVSDGAGDYLASDQATDTTGTLSAGDTTEKMTITVRTAAKDGVDEANGMITVTILDDNAPAKYTPHATDAARTRLIADADVPVVSIAYSSTVHTTGVVTEGNAVTFAISADIAPWQDITVTTELATSDFLADDANDMGTIVAGELTGTIVVETVGNETFGEHGVIKATLQDGTGYTPEMITIPAVEEGGEPTMEPQSASIDIKDDEETTISIMDGVDVIEGASATFTISATGTRTTELKINYTITPGDADFIASTVNKDHFVTMPVSATGDTVTLSVLTVDNDTDNSGDTQTITVTIDAHDTDKREYEISSTNASATANVTDMPMDMPAGEPRLPVDELQATSTTGGENVPAANEGDFTIVVSVTAASEEVREGEEAVFTISLNQSIEIDTPVSISVDQGDSNILESLPPRSVTILAGETETTLTLVTVNDYTVSEDRELTVAIVNERGYVADEANGRATATTMVKDVEEEQRIKRYGMVNDSIVPEVLAAVGGTLIEVISESVEHANTSGLEGEYLVEFAGQTSIQDVLQYKAQELNDSAYSWASLLENSSFRVPLVPASESDVAVSIWGSGDYTLLSDNYDSDVSRNGELYAAHLGFDALYQNGMVIGSTTTYFESDVEFSSGEFNVREGTHQTQVGGLHPYIGWASEGRVLEVWSTAGYGQGTIEIDEMGVDPETMSTSYYVLAAGTSNLVFSTRDLLFDGDIDIRVRSEAWTAGQRLSNGTGILNHADQDADYEVYLVRFAGDGSHVIDFESGSRVETAASAGMRWDGGSNESGLGVELGADLSYDAYYGLTASGGARILMSRANILREWGLNAELQYDSDQDSAGLQVYVTPTWGEAHQGGVDQLWETGVFDEEDGLESRGAEAQMDTEIGYGFQLLDDTSIITPFSGVNFRQQGQHEYRLGGRFSFGPDLNLTMEGSQRPLFEGDVNRDVSINTNYKW